MEKLTVTLTGRPPVKITKDDWPIIASAEDKQWDGQHECQANRTTICKVIVRQHNDGRTLVYGIYTYSTCWQGEQSKDMRGGELLTVEGASDEEIGDVETIIAAIKRVAGEMLERTGDEAFSRLIHECIADLPAVEL
jgi:hypothetical protein